MVTTIIFIVFYKIAKFNDFELSMLLAEHDPWPPPISAPCGIVLCASLSYTEKEGWYGARDYMTLWRWCFHYSWSGIIESVDSIIESVDSISRDGPDMPYM